MDFQNKYFSSNTRLEVGKILSVNNSDGEFLSYNVFIENFHNEKEFTIGVPIFSFGYNSYTYIVGCRVICLIKDDNYNEVIIIGQIYDKSILRKVLPPLPGQLQLSISSSQKTGFAEFGFNDKFLIYAGNSNLKFDSSSFEFKVNRNVFLNFSDSQFNLKLNSNNGGFLIKEDKIFFNNFNGFYSFSVNGPVFFQGQKFSFTEGNSQKPNLLISKGLHRQIGVEYQNIFSTYKFSGGSKVKGVDDTVDWNILTGNYAIRLGTGDFKLNLLNSLGAEVYFKIGIGPLYLSQFSLTQSALEIKIGAALPDSMKLGGGTLDVKVGNLPGLQTELLLEGSSAELKVKGTLGNSTFSHKSGSIKFENNSLTTGTSASFEISNGDLILKSASKTLGGRITLDGEVTITGELIVKDKIYSTGEVFAKATVTGDTASTTNAVGLSTHKHPTAIPGPVSPPTPGT